MQALQYRQGTFEFNDVEEPKLTHATDAIVRILKTTICGTDLHILKGNVPTVESGRTLGHEGIGIIEKLGDACGDLRVGDLVLISTVTACGNCQYCRRKIFGQCLNGGWVLGHLVNGCQAEYVRIPHARNSLYKLPKNLSNTQLNSIVMLSDILPTAFEIGITDGNVQPGKTIAIVGAGPVGLSAILSAHLYSPEKIIVIDIDPHRLEKAKEMGADVVINNKNGDAVEQVLSMTKNEGVDVAIEAIGIPEGWYICEDIVKAGGNIAILGVHGKKATIHLDRMWSKNFTLTAGIVHGYSTEMLLDRVLSKKLASDMLISHELDLSNINQAYHDFSNAAATKSLKVIINNDLC